MDWLKIASIVLNVLLTFLLAVALFFKGPLNDLAKRLGIGWLDRRERRLEMIRQLYARMDRFPSGVAAQMILTAMGTTPIIKDLPERDKISAVVKPFVDELDASRAFIRERFLDFPGPVQALLKELRSTTEAAFRLPEIWPGIDLEVEYRRMNTAVQEVNRLSAKIREALEREV